jgi:hypothetical protein
MSQPGTKVPPSRFPKEADGCTKLPEAPGSKTVGEQRLDFVRGTVADLKSANGETAPSTRVYSRDYSKRDPDADQGDDTLSPFLGRPIFRL